MVCGGGIMTLDVAVMASGYCTAHRRVEDPTGPGGHRRFYATWLVIRHPTLGIVLFDTGYSDHVFRAARHLPDRAHLWVTPVTVAPQETAVARLAAMGVTVDDVRHVIISHFHVDHIGGLRDFPAATIYATAAAYGQVRQVQGVAAVRRGVLRGLLPDDLQERIVMVEDVAEAMADPDSDLTMYRTFMGQQELVPVLLPGHARGMLGLYIPSQRMLFATDAAWSSDTFRRGVLPRQVVRLFFDSWSGFVQTQQQLRAFIRANPDVRLLFTHCPDTMQFVAHA